MFDNVCRNRRRVLVELCNCGFAGDHPNTRLGIRQQVHFALEAFEAQIMRAFAIALWSRWQVLPIAYIHDAMLLPSRLPSSDVKELFRRVAAEFDNIQMILQVESWAEDLQAAWRVVLGS